MRAYDFILRKRNGERHAREEIREFIEGYVSGKLSDAQAAAWCMAVCFNGLSLEEMSHLTEAMVDSGDVVSLNEIPGIKVDKHSTGGVGDKTTLVLGPMVASLGLPVAKMSGRGLGHTGGTLDKLESFAGLTVELDRERFIRQVSRIGIAVAGQTGNLVPADKKLYALRDETATVQNVGLIASSIMSKKIAAGAEAIVLDVKVGSGAFMKDQDGAAELARAMVHIGRAAGRKTVAVLSNMDQPLGQAVGNAIEVREAIETLRGHGPSDLYELCLELGSHMAVLGGACRDAVEARQRLEKSVQTGAALGKLRDLIEAQGGNPRMVDHPDELPSARICRDWVAPSSGYVAGFDTEAIGLAASVLGAGRERKGDPVDHGVGLTILRKLGDPVSPGEPLITVHANDERRLEDSLNRLAAAIAISPEKPAIPALILERI